MRWWFTLDVTSWTKTADEWIGLREKLWVVDPFGASWLRKKPLSWRATELAVEAFTLELARRCGYNVAFGRCCTWETEEGIVRGFASRKFHDTTEEQFVGGQLVAPKLDLPAELTHDLVEARRRALSTIELTRNVLKEQKERYCVDLLAPFFASWSLMPGSAMATVTQRTGRFLCGAPARLRLSPRAHVRHRRLLARRFDG